MDISRRLIKYKPMKVTAYHYSKTFYSKIGIDIRITKRYSRFKLCFKTENFIGDTCQKIKRARETRVIAN